MSDAVSCQMQCHVRCSVMSDAVSCQMQCHVRCSVMSDAVSCQMQCHVRCSVMSDAVSCQMQCPGCMTSKLAVVVSNIRTDLPAYLLSTKQPCVYIV